MTWGDGTDPVVVVDGSFPPPTPGIPGEISAAGRPVSSRSAEQLAKKQKVALKPKAFCMCHMIA